MAACDALNRVYVVLHPYLNGYLPTMKLIGKQRDGARVHKQYDVPQTPYRRVLASELAVSELDNSMVRLVAHRIKLVP